MKFYLGIDCGSVSLKLAVLDEDKNVLWTTYQRTHGAPLEQLKVVIERMIRSHELTHIKSFERIFATGSGRFIIGEIFGATLINEITAHGAAAANLYPLTRTIIEIGGQDSKLILLEKLLSGETVVTDSQMNEVCAAGTGSFLDQQAYRMGIDVGELAKRACISRNPAKVSGRCSVFAKTDMIHLQQEGISTEDLSAGLCRAVARNYIENLIKGRHIVGPVLFQGGVARNEGVRKAFLSLLKLSDSDIIMPEHHGVMGAIGAVFGGLKHAGSAIDLCRDALISRLQKIECRTTRRAILPVLTDKGVVESSKKIVTPNPNIPIDAYIGVDVGSVSAKIAVVDRNANIIFNHYATTEGNPISAVKQCFDLLRNKLPLLKVRGVGATGSGRSLIASYLNVDVVRNEITAQAHGAAKLVPNVDVVIEIGGQDSKYIRMKNGVVVEFVMNKTCAAGTGSFLVEQADRINVSLEQFSEMAFRAKNPVDMGTRCTVFMETDCIHYQQQGNAKEDIIAGLSYSVARNYLEKVVGNHPIEGNIAIQGGIAFNKSVLAAFANLLDRPVTITPFHEVTGALGMALISRDEMANKGDSRFVGLNLESRMSTKTVSRCNACSNVCNLIHINYSDGKRAVHGGMCGRFEERQNHQAADQLPDYFEERKRILFSYGVGVGVGVGKRKDRIGIPRVLLVHELLPLWATFFIELGHDVVLSGELSKEMHEIGMDNVLIDTCFPIRAMYGAVTSLVQQGVKKIFFPYVINMSDDGYKTQHAHNCQYIQQAPDLIRASMDVEILTHTVWLKQGGERVERAFVELGEKLGASKAQAKSAYRKALSTQQGFYAKYRALGERALVDVGNFDKALVLIGHPYIVHDVFFNLNLVKRLAKIGIPVLPGDALPLERAVKRASQIDLKWKTNNLAVNVLDFITKHNSQGGTRLLPVILTQFGCAADSMLTPYMKDILGDNPWIELEVDEHNSATGMITRCEAFWDSVTTNIPIKDAFSQIDKLSSGCVTLQDIKRENRTIFILPICDAMYAVPEVLGRFGVRSKIISKTTQHSNNLGRKYSNEKHCRTYQVILGDLLSTIQQDGFDSKKSAFFMFDYEEACRLALFSSLYEKVLKEHGAGDIKMFGTVVDDPVGWIRSFGMRTAIELWVAIIATDYLSRYKYELRPSEKIKGSIDEAYQEAVQILFSGIRANATLKQFPVAMNILKNVPIVKKDLVQIGIIGDAFTRVHQYGMAEIFAVVEEMGGVVNIPPSWSDFINYGSRRRVETLMQNRNLSRATFTMFGSLTLDRLKRKVQKIATNYSYMFDEPSNQELTKLAEQYVNSRIAPVIPSMFIGKTVDFIESKNIHGLINAYGFNCSLGKISTACISRLRSKNRDVPMFTFVDDGLQQTNVRTRVEAFMEQAKAHKRKIEESSLKNIG